MFFRNSNRNKKSISQCEIKGSLCDDIILYYHNKQLFQTSEINEAWISVMEFEGLIQIFNKIYFLLHPNVFLRINFILLECHLMNSIQDHFCNNKRNHNIKNCLILSTKRESKHILRNSFCEYSQ